MKTQLTVAVAVLGAVLAAPSVVMAEDVVSDQVIQQSADQNRYNAAVAKRAAKVQTAPRAQASGRSFDEGFEANSR